MDRHPKVTVLQWTPDLVDRFQPIAARNPWGALESAGEQLHGSYVFEVEQGAQCALMAVRPVQCVHGLRAELVGLVSDAPLFRFEAIDRAAVLVARQLGADVLAFSTQLPRLVKGAQRVGWITSGAIVTKSLKAGNA